MKYLASISLPLYALDQATKWWIYKSYALVPSEQNLRFFPEVIAAGEHLPIHREVIPETFQIVHWANTGAAFSLGAGNNWFFIVISFVAMVALLFAWSKRMFVDRWSRGAVPLLIAGILGNVTDRIVHGYVVDFLLFDLSFWPANPWPAFNVADACICIAVGLFLIAAILDGKKKEQPAVAEGK
jgi:signal peptidase II